MCPNFLTFSDYQHVFRHAHIYIPGTYMHIYMSHLSDMYMYVKYENIYQYFYHNCQIVHEFKTTKADDVDEENLNRIKFNRQVL